MKKALLIIRRAIAIVFVFCFYHSFAQNDADKKSITV